MERFGNGPLPMVTVCPQEGCFVGRVSTGTSEVRHFDVESMAVLHTGRDPEGLVCSEDSMKLVGILPSRCTYLRALYAPLLILTS
eukprot:361939-Chlamydomonas_euryale.AAC.9